MPCDLAKGQKDMTKLIFPQKSKIVTIFVLCFVYKHFDFFCFVKVRDLSEKFPKGSHNSQFVPPRCSQWHHTFIAYVLGGGCGG
jgi:hypothetical protein